VELITEPIKTNSQLFVDHLLQLKANTLKNLSKQDYLHLRKLIFVNRFFLMVGFLTAWILPNPFSMLCISIALHGQWTIVGHHVCHGGYDKVPGTPNRYRSDHFALGWRRYVDWLDWIYTPAWKYEHNVLHHFYTNEQLDPDVSAESIKHYFNPEWPLWLRFVILILNMCTWKIIYFSTNTLKAFYEKKNYDPSRSPSDYFKQALIFSYIPYFTIHFIFIPFLFFPLGKIAVLFVLINRIGAEILTNIHTFLTIVPSHAGADIPLQTKHFSSKEEFFMNQIQSTCDYHTGGFWRDYLQGYVNYQIEHHLFPDLPVSQYVKLQPKIKALCQQYGIPYKQESLFLRIKKTFRVLLMIDKQK